MKFATLHTGKQNGRLLVVSKDLSRAADAGAIVPSLLDALDRWDEVRASLESLYQCLNAGQVEASMPFDSRDCAAPLPRAPQWLDGSAFLSHGKLMQKVFGTPPIADAETVPLLYQGASDDFIGPNADVYLPDEADDIDMEGEFGVILGEVPMATTQAKALDCVRLLVQINDWSLRRYGPREMSTGFGFVQAKPSTSFAPVAITPDEIGGAWQNGRIRLRLDVERSGQWVGNPSGAEMSFSFGQLIAHAARTRRLRAGTIIGSGTVSNQDASVGVACLAERRMRDILEFGKPQMPYLRFGERVRMTAMTTEGEAPFGSIEQTLKAYRAT